MIDPDTILVISTNENNKIVLSNIAPYEDLIWDLDDDKEYKKYVKAVEKEVRQSYEYREMIRFFKENYDMNRCAFLNISGENKSHVKIEIHHYPFTLSDVVEIVLRKRQYYQENTDVQMVAKECTILHYKLLIGLIPLSKTAHQLYHDGKLFIPVDKVVGRYDIFSDIYGQFVDDYQRGTLERIKEASLIEENDFRNTTVLDDNAITIENKQKEYQLPNFAKIEEGMYHRISDIKNNNYRLPNLEDYENLNKKDDTVDRRCVVDALVFFK
jgi:hypothetical protein